MVKRPIDREPKSALDDIASRRYFFARRPEWRNGRRRGFKIPRRKACEFESRLGHQNDERRGRRAVSRRSSIRVRIGWTGELR